MIHDHLFRNAVKKRQTDLGGPDVGLLWFLNEGYNDPSIAIFFNNATVGENVMLV